MNTRAAIKDCIVDVLRAILGPDVPIAWENTDEDCGYKGYPRVTLSWTANTTIGVDERRYRYLPPPEDVMNARQCGIREFTLGIKITSDSHCGDRDADSQLDLVRLRLRRECNLNTLRGCGVGVVRFMASQLVDYKMDGRWYSAALMDITLAWAQDDDPDDCANATDYFDQVDVQHVPS